MNASYEDLLEELDSSKRFFKAQFKKETKGDRIDTYWNNNVETLAYYFYLMGDKHCRDWRKRKVKEAKP